MRKPIYYFIVSICSTLLLGGTAQAYLDPGSTSMIWQLVLSILAAAAVFIKIFWAKLYTLFGFRNKRTERPADSDQNTSILTLHPLTPNWRP